ncbi:MAG: hypothetical protein GX321_08565 [Clostridiales bacterium]|nr:hypothetical protein [Clostridiales bacterium]
MLKKPWKYSFVFILVISISILINPLEVTGEVKPITEAEEQLKGISKEEQATLEKLFIYTQELEEMERQQAGISQEIEKLIREIDGLDKSIEKEEEKYNLNLGIMEQVLVSYQRSGPASYLEVLLNAKNLTSFIKSLNLIKDITKNTGELLTSIEESKQYLEESRQNLYDSKVLLETKRVELEESIANKKRLLKEQEDYLNSLEEQKELYEKHLDNLKLMWDNIKILFSEVVDEFTRIVREGHFTMDDLHIEFSFLSVKGSLHEDVFNRILNDNSSLTDMYFSFTDDGVKLDVPGYNLKLEGHFVIDDKMILLFVPEAGTFYDMHLEKESIDELFNKQPLIINFESIAGDMILIDVELNKVYTEKEYLRFTLKTSFFF